MKTLLVAIALFIGLGTSAMAMEEALPDTTLLSQDTIQEFGMTEGVEEAQEWAGSRCSAVHQCRSGRTIGCTASGIVTRCYRGGGQVLCRAWGANGTFSQASDRCRH